MPFPSNENVASPFPPSQVEAANPWKRVAPNEGIALWVQFIFANGLSVSYPASDIREVRMRDAGHIEIMILGSEKYRISIEGRNLSELNDLLLQGRIKCVLELGRQSFRRPEELPSIDRLEIEALTGPSMAGMI